MCKGHILFIKNDPKIARNKLIASMVAQLHQTRLSRDRLDSVYTGLNRSLVNVVVEIQLNRNGCYAIVMHDTQLTGRQCSTARLLVVALYIMTHEGSCRNSVYLQHLRQCQLSVGYRRVRAARIGLSLLNVFGYCSF